MYGHRHRHGRKLRHAIRPASIGPRRRAAALGALLALVTLPATACSSSDSAPRSKSPAPSATATRVPPATPAASAAPRTPEAHEPTPDLTPEKEAKVYTPADFCKNKDKLLEPAKRIVLSIANAGEKNGTMRTMGAAEPKLNCGPGVDNDGYFDTDVPLGPYYVADNVTVRLLTYDGATQRMELQSAGITTLADVVKACAAGATPAKPYTCGGNLFYATLDEKTGVVTHLTGIFQS
ncbi:hypothetical protein [Streptomyces triculaminicus]|uniref:hypothetical protein n=1 Tax=Streptomyces triculaminicus TaxID=2816232 RepID=UPI0037CF36BF